MNFKKILKIVAVIAALCAVAAAAYFAIKKLTGKEKPEYFDDNDFFECDNDLEIVEVDGDEALDEAAEEAVEEPAAEEELEAEAESEEAE